MTPDDPRHGSYNGYTNGPCRCDACCDGMRRHKKAYNARRALTSPQANTAMLRVCPFCGRPNDLAHVLRPFCSLDCVAADRVSHMSAAA